MKKLILWLVIFSMACLLVGCAKDDLKAPCPNYGKYCSKTPINSWDYQNQ